MRRPEPLDAMLVYFLVFFYVMYGGIFFGYFDSRPLDLAFPVGIAAIPLVYARLKRFSLQGTFPLLRPITREVAGSILMTVGILIVVISCSFLLHAVMPDLDTAGEGSLVGDGFWYGLLFVAVLPAVTEEILCRGLILSALRDRMRKWPAILMCSTMFACLHLEPFRIPFTFLSGLVITWVAWETSSIILPTIMHFFHNGALFLIMWHGSGVADDTVDSGVAESVDWSSTGVLLFVFAGIATVSLIYGARLFAPRESQRLST